MSECEKDSEAATKAVCAGLVLLLFIPHVLWEAVVTTKLWSWFVDPTMHIHLPFIAAVGISLVLSLFGALLEQDLKLLRILSGP